MNRLRARGHDLTLVMIVGRPPREVLAALADCDFVIDELYSDTPVAAFATEAAAFGKPAVVGMHDVEPLRRTVPPGMFPPSLVCHPDGLDEAVEKLVVDEAYRRRLGAEAQAYVREHWSADIVATRFLRLASGDVPGEWMFDPSDLRYVHGWGLTLSRLRQVIAGTVAEGGFEALGISDKPELLQRFRELVADATIES